MATWQSRVTRTDNVDPNVLLEHLDNIVVHGAEQEQQMMHLLKTIGWAQQIIVSEFTGRIIDGHLRVAIARKLGLKTVPVQYVELSEAEEAKALVYLKRTTMLARIDPATLEAVLNEVSSSDDEIAAMAASFAAEAGVLKMQDRRKPREVVQSVDVKIGGITFPISWAAYAFWRGAMQQKWGVTHYEIKADIRRLLGLL